MLGLSKFFSEKRIPNTLKRFKLWRQDPEITKFFKNKVKSVDYLMKWHCPIQNDIL